MPKYYGFYYILLRGVYMLYLGVKIFAFTLIKNADILRKSRTWMRHFTGVNKLTLFLLSKMS